MRMDDIDLNLNDFVARVNSDLVGKLVNIASRCAGFITKGDGKSVKHWPSRPCLKASWPKKDYCCSL